MTRVRRNPHRDDEIRARYERGEGQQELADEFGVTHQRISQIVRGVTPPPRSRRCDGCGSKISRGSPVDLCRACKKRLGVRPKWTDAAIIAALRNFYTTYGHSPTAADLNTAMARKLGHEEKVERYYQDGLPPLSVLHTYFGGLNVALERAGLPTRRQGERLTASARCVID